MLEGSALDSLSTSLQLSSEVGYENDFRRPWLKERLMMRAETIHNPITEGSEDQNNATLPNVLLNPHYRLCHPSQRILVSYYQSYPMYPSTADNKGGAQTNRA